MFPRNFSVTFYQFKPLAPVRQQPLRTLTFAYRWIWSRPIAEQILYITGVFTCFRPQRHVHDAVVVFAAVVALAHVVIFIITNHIPVVGRCRCRVASHRCKTNIQDLLHLSNATTVLRLKQYSVKGKTDEEKERRYFT